MIRPSLLCALVLLPLAACGRGAQEGGEPATPPASAAPALTPPPPPAAMPAPLPVSPLSAAERRRQLREAKDGEAETIRAPIYEGASSAATAIPNEGETGASAPGPADPPALDAPPPPPPAPSPQGPGSPG